MLGELKWHIKEIASTIAKLFGQIDGQTLRKRLISVLYQSYELDDIMNPQTVT